MEVGPIKVQLYCKELKRYKLMSSFTDSKGIAVGNTYSLDEFGDRKGPYVWVIRKVFD